MPSRQLLSTPTLAMTAPVTSELDREWSEDMIRCVLVAWIAATCWWCATGERLRTDDRGAVTTETAIITALLAGAAFALATYIAVVVLGWQARIPT